MLSIHRQDTYGVRAILPRPEGRGLPRILIKPDLATVFTEPWLEFSPNLDAQAQLLAALQPTPVADFERALQQLQPTAPPTSPASVVPPAPTPPTASPALPHATHPRDFLLAVMNDPGTDLQWRIEAAKALLPWFER